MSFLLGGPGMCPQNIDIEDIINITSVLSPFAPNSF